MSGSTRTRTRTRRARGVAVVAFFSTLVGGLAGTASDVSAWDLWSMARPLGEPRYLHPVEAEVTRGFEVVDQPYGPGNRGLDYGVAPDAPVRAAGSGRVTFAGPVAGSLFVTIQHADGIRTSYSYLERIDVRIGDVVRMGDRVGLTSGRFQLGMRRGTIYIDPAPLLGRTLIRRSRLVVPVDSRRE